MEKDNPNPLPEISIDHWPEKFNKSSEKISLNDGQIRRLERHQKFVVNYWRALRPYKSDPGIAQSLARLQSTSEQIVRIVDEYRYTKARILTQPRLHSSLYE